MGRRCGSTTSPASCNLDTLRLRPSMIALARLVDYQLAPPVPAAVDIVADLSSSAGIGDRIVKARSRFSNGATPELPAVLFEYVSDDDLLLTQATGSYGFGSYLATASSPQTFDEVLDHTAAPGAAVLFDGSTGFVPAANLGGCCGGTPT